MKQFKGGFKNKQGGWIVPLLIASTVGQLYSANEGAKAADRAAQAEREAIAAQERSANVRAQQERIKQQREARIARERVIASATNSGVGTASSGVAGATGSITSQEGANIGAINVAQSFATAASEANQRAANARSDIAGAQATGAQWQALGSFSSSIFGAKGGWSSIFSDPVAPAQASGTMSPDQFMNPTKISIGK